MLVIRALIAHCESAVAAAGDGVLLDDPMEVAQSVGEVATMLVAAGLEWESDPDPDRAAGATRLRALAVRCQQVIEPFVRGRAGPEQRDRAWVVLREIAEALRTLADRPS